MMARLVLRNRLQWVVGLLAPGIALAWVWLTLILKAPGVDATVGDRLGNVAAAFAIAGLSLGFLAIGWYPRMIVGDTQVQVLNPLRTYSVDRHLISGVDADGRAYPVLVAGDQRIRLIGLEQSLSLWPLERGEKRLSRQLRDLFPPQRGPGSSPQAYGVESRRRTITPVEAGVVCAWVLTLLVLVRSQVG